MQRCQALILTPTREIAYRTHKSITLLGEYIDVSINTVVGGVQVKCDIDKLQEEPQILVGTPGRMLNLLKRTRANVDHLKVLVVDEVDEMLGRGFYDCIKDLLGILPSKIQLVVCSATIPPEIHDFTKRFMNSPVTISNMTGESLTLEGIKQFYIAVENEEQKPDTLLNFLLSISKQYLERV